MMQDAQAPPPSRNWTWTLAAGFLTLLLAAIAFLLPLVEWMPRGAIVGWLLLLAGISELTFGWKHGLDAVGKAAVCSGAFTAIAGLLFVANPLASYLPVANLVMAWLVLRGGWMLAMGIRLRNHRLGSWLALSGAADLLLGFALLVGLQVSALVVALFGPTPEVVATFALILAVSFLVAGISQVAIALLQRRKTRIEG